MQTNTSATSGAQSSTSGDDEKKETQSTSGDEVSTLKEHLTKMQKELQNYREKAKVTEAELKASKEKELLAQQKWEEAYKHTKQEAEEFKTKYEGLSSQLLNQKKESEIKSELMKLGLDPKYSDDVLRLVPVERVQIDSATGMVLGVADVAKDFYSKYGDTGFFKKQSVTVNHGPTKVISNTPEEAFKVELRQAKNQKELEAVMKKYGKV